MIPRLTTIPAPKESLTIKSVLCTIVGPDQTTLYSAESNNSPGAAFNEDGTAGNITLKSPPHGWFYIAIPGGKTVRGYTSTDTPFKLGMIVWAQQDDTGRWIIMGRA